jgi:hypothetical protein
MQHSSAITATIPFKYFVHAGHCRIGPKGPAVVQLHVANITDPEYDMRGRTIENGSNGQKQIVLDKL